MKTRNLKKHLPSILEYPKSWKFFCLVATILVSACANQADEDASMSTGEREDKLVGGTATNLRPEIGRWNRGCTGTLIAPHYVLTAGHCSNYSTTVYSGDAFIITDASGVTHSYAVDRIHIFGAYRAAGSGAGIAFEMTPDNVGTNDVEILHLSTNVPSSIATPAQLATRPPNTGERATIFGYGCTDRGAGSGGGYKQYYSFNYGTTTSALCPGDSGGPVVYGNASSGGQIWGTNTGYTGSGADVFGNVTYFKNQVLDLMLKWDSMSLEVGINHAGYDYRSLELSSPVPESCRTACIQDSACRAFTYVAPGIQGVNARCWLKSSIGDWTPCSYCTSGASLLQESNIDRPGSDYANFNLPAPRPELCLASCARDSGCQSYTYVIPGVQGPSARCWLKSSIPSTSSNSATVSGARRGFEVNIDRPGKDYSNFNLSSADPKLCRDSCARDLTCKAFTYVAPGIQGSTARCWLKSAVPSANAGAGVTSGVKRGLEVNTDRGGSDYRSFDQDIAVPEVCQATCAAEAACQAFTYVPPGVQATKARCWLKSGVPTATQSEGLVSGIKGAEFF